MVTRQPSAVRRRRAQARRPGMTLMEMLLVLALLVAIAALAVPNYQAPLNNYRLRKAGDIIRIEWARARIRAMKTGQIQMFQYEPAGSQYLTQVSYTDEGMLDLSVPTTQIASGSPMSMQDPLGLGASQSGAPQQLPEGVTFAGSDTLIDARAMYAAQQSMTSGAVPDWSQPIVFYPDGTSSDAQILLVNERGKYVVVRLRGLTGIAKVSDLLAAEEIPQ